MFAEQEGCSLGNLVAGTCTLSSRGVNHGLIALTVGIKLVVGEGSNDDAWRDAVDASATPALRGGCGTLSLQMVHSLGNHVGQT